jgi:hypothetical protein
MRPSDDDEPTTKEVVAAVRAELDRGEFGLPPFVSDPATPDGLCPRIDWFQLLQGVRYADVYARAAANPPEFRRLPLPLRFLARLVIRVFLLPARYFLQVQGAFNQTAVGVIYHIYGLMRFLEGQNRRDLDLVKTELRQQDARLQALRARLDELEGRRRRNAA